MALGGDNILQKGYFGFTFEGGGKPDFKTRICKFGGLKVLTVNPSGQV